MSNIEGIYSSFWVLVSLELMTVLELYQRHLDVDEKRERKAGYVGVYKYLQEEESERFERRLWTHGTFRTRRPHGDDWP